ncbi:cryptochrome/photolyase family protein [bacterium]|nr:cryptochrome/photolyase family protein [bacterium]
MKYVLVLGNQLFRKRSSCISAGDTIFMAEDYGLCTHFRYHRQKLYFFLAAMRHYRDYLRESPGTTVVYHELAEDPASEPPYEERLREFLEEHEVSTLHVHEIEDKFFEERVKKLCEERSIELVIEPSPMFLVSRGKFNEYLGRVERPFMKTFYEELRRETGYLMAGKSPIGGQYSFDAENRKRLPKDLEVPEVAESSGAEHTHVVEELVNAVFSDHPGEERHCWLPVTHDGADRWLEKFFDERFKLFGDYEDALAKKTPFLFHSGISALLNIGLLTPEGVLEAAIEREEVPLNSREGFLRQVLGWREFVRGIYQNYSEEQEKRNFWNHTRKLKSCWYDGTTEIPPVDDAIAKAHRYGYNHHIERLMVLSNVMLLTEIDPREVHRWFMEMYVDSSDWVMGPNVYGMAQYSDGGIFATKPYTCGSNYIRKMSTDYGKGDWCDELDGLYWRFIDLHEDFYRSNGRMSQIVGNLERMASDRKERIFAAAERCIERVSAKN